MGCRPATQASLESYSSVQTTVMFPPLLLSPRVTPQNKPLYIDIKLSGRCLGSRYFVWLVKFVGILNNPPRQALYQKLGGSSLAALAHEF